MTQKRFIKLLMSKGVQRNRAVATAIYLRKHNIEYRLYWGFCFEDKAGKMVAAMIDVVRQGAERIACFVESWKVGDENESV